MTKAANPLTSITESQSMCGSIVLRTAFSTARTDVISRAYEQVATMLSDAPATAIEVTFTDDIINIGPTLNVSRKDHIIAYAVSEDEISSENLVESYRIYKRADLLRYIQISVMMVYVTRLYLRYTMPSIAKVER